MNEALKQFSDDVAAKLKAKIEGSEFASFIAKTKASGDDRTFEVVMSTDDEDRQGDALDQSNWDLKYFEMNPVLLWAHNYQGFPIGIITDIKIEGDKAVATGKFAPAGMNPEADLACSLYQEKILRAVSPGYIQHDDGSRELLEVSFCPVPAGRYALSLRQVGKLGLSTRELIAKGFFYNKAKASGVGDPCELEDGTPGVLSEDPDDPKTLVCVPANEGKSKSNETQEDMNNELTKKLKAENERHRADVGEHVTSFAEEATANEKASEGEGEDNGMEKAVQEFTEKMDAEQADHLEKCMKAIEEYKAEDGKKSIDDFKKDIEGEHLKHVKAFDKAIESFTKKAEEKPEETEKALEEFKSDANDELDRHEEAHMDMCKAEFGGAEDDGKSEKKAKGAVAEEMQEDVAMQAKYKRIDKAYSVFSAFISAYLDEKAAVEDYDTLLDEAVALMKDTETKAFPNSTIRPLIGKAGRTISSKTKEKIDAVIKAVEKHHADHGADTDTVIAALKEIISPQQGDEGKDDEEEKSFRAPNARSTAPRAATNEKMSELDTYLFAQRLLRQVKSASEDGLRQLKEDLKAKYPSRR